MKPAPMLAKVIARLSWLSSKLSSAWRRCRASASSDAMTACSWLTDGIFSAFGISGHSTIAVTIEIAAVTIFTSVSRP